MLAALVAVLSIPEVREIFKTLTRAYAYTTGYLKIAILGFARKQAQKGSIRIPVS